MVEFKRRFRAARLPALHGKFETFFLKDVVVAKVGRLHLSLTSQLRRPLPASFAAAAVAANRAATEVYLFNVPLDKCEAAGVASFAASLAAHPKLAQVTAREPRASVHISTTTTMFILTIQSTTCSVWRLTISLTAASSTSF